MKKARTDWDKVKWTKFQEGSYSDEALQLLGGLRKRTERKVYLNSIYQVELSWIQCPPPFGLTAYLSIKTLDKQPRHDWREMQQIKNELVGYEVEAVELYPTEERLVDAANQYHLYCFPELACEEGIFPFGFRERLVAEGSEPGIAKTGKGSRQKDFRSELKPSDTVRGEDLNKLIQDPGKGVGGRCPQDGSPLIYVGPFTMTTEGRTVHATQAKCLKNEHVCLFMDKTQFDGA